jgi:hypothetical protein
MYFHIIVIYCKLHYREFTAVYCDGTVNYWSINPGSLPLRFTVNYHPFTAKFYSVPQHNDLTMCLMFVIQQSDIHRVIEMALLISLFQT